MTHKELTDGAINVLGRMRLGWELVYSHFFLAYVLRDLPTNVLNSVGQQDVHQLLTSGMIRETDKPTDDLTIFEVTPAGLAVPLTLTAPMRLAAEHIERLRDYLAETHTEEVNNAHFGDDEAGHECSYCDAIQLATSFLRRLGVETE